MCLPEIGASIRQTFANNRESPGARARRREGLRQQGVLDEAKDFRRKNPLRSDYAPGKKFTIPIGDRD